MGLVKLSEKVSQICKSGGTSLFFFSKTFAKAGVGGMGLLSKRHVELAKSGEGTSPFFFFARAEGFVKLSAGAGGISQIVCKKLVN